jgi:dTDP-4-amino-4,6-dideoxygalactose transaminase
MSGALAILGGDPVLPPSPPAELAFFPSRDRFAASFAGIFDRQYYPNQGPLADALERRLAEALEVRHAICVTNGTIGLMMAAEALGLRGRVIVPAISAAPALALGWAGVEPLFCDIDPVTLQPTAALVAEALRRAGATDVTAIMGVNLWGGACEVAALATLARAKGLRLLFDSAHGFGCAVGGKPLGSFGAAEVFSLGRDKILTAIEGGCVTTDDDDLAARLRNIRSSYGAGRPVSVVRTANGRMSEAQAAIALMSLDDYDANRRHDSGVRRLYEEGLRTLAGIRLVPPVGVSASNRHYAVATVDEVAFGLDAAALVAVLAAENVAAQRCLGAGLHRTPPWGSRDRPAADLPGVDAVVATALRMPLGGAVSLAAAERVCETIIRAHRAAPKIRTRLG